MTELEKEIEKLETRLATTKENIEDCGGEQNVPKLVEKKNAIEQELAAKKAQLQSSLDSTSFYEFLKAKFNYSHELQVCIKSTVDHLTDPQCEDTSVPGLLLGSIQSGKTRAFVGVMALAFDKGFDACLVLTKPDDGLVNQTRYRLENDFTGMQGDSEIEVFDVNKDMTISSVQLLSKNIFVLHKNSARLKAMKKILDTYYSNKKVLIIDDEADFVSRTFYTSQRQVRAGVTGFHIDKLTDNPQIDCYYLQVTATPYSLLLQPEETISVTNGILSCFHPRFTVLVPIHDHYIGGEQYFELSKNADSMFSMLYTDISNECFDRLLKKNADQRITRNADRHPFFAGLRYALMSYFVGASIRMLQERQCYKTSFLIHCATEKDDHTYEKKIVDIILTSWQKLINQSNVSSLSADFDKAFKEFQISNHLGNTCIYPITNSTELDNLSFPSKEDVWNKYVEIFTKRWYDVKCINGDTSDDPNLYDKDGQLKLASYLNIFIGGFKADRGITINNMIGFVYGRRPQNGGNANTILQHMRNYGNRSMKDMSVTRFYTTVDLYDKLEDIYYTDKALRMSLKDNAIPSVVYINYDPTTANYRLCNPNQIRMSDIKGYSSFGRIIATAGLQTGSQNMIGSIVSSIDQKLQSFGKDREHFIMSKSEAIAILKDIKKTYVYDKKYQNVNCEWDEDFMIAAIENYADAQGQLYGYYRINKSNARMKKSGFNDAPEDGKNDTAAAKQYAIDKPFLMFMRENGKKTDGWNDAPFYWPVLRLPINANPLVYCKESTTSAGRAQKTLVITDAHGSPIQGKNLSDTIKQCLLAAKPENVEKLQIKYRNNNLVYSAARKPKDYHTLVPGKYYVRKGISSNQAESLLKEISNKLNLNWTIEIK